MGKILCLSALSAVILSSVWIQRNDGLDHTEHYITIPHYLSDKSLLHKIFDIVNTEAPSSPGNFQAREFSYFTDYLDVKAMAAFVPLAGAHSLSFIKFFATFLIVFLLRTFLRSHLGFGEGMTFLFLLLLLSSPAFFLGGFFHRTAKIDATLFFVALFVWCVRVWRLGETRMNLFVTFLLSFFLAISDMTGHYVLWIGVVILVIRRLLLRDLRASRLLVPFVGAIGCYLVYKWVFAPMLIHAFNGYYPTFDFQRLPIATLKSDLSMYLLKSWLLLEDYARFLFGDVNRLAVGFLLLTIMLSPFLSRSSRDARVGVAIHFLVLVAVWFMLVLMGAKHEAIFLPPYRRVYYALLPTVVFFIGFAFFFRRLCVLPRYFRYFATAMLMFFIFRNFESALGSHRQTLYDYGLGSSGKVYARLVVLRRWDEYKDTVTPLFGTDSILKAMADQF